MDPITLITSAPPEWMPLLILIAIGVKAWQWYVLRDVGKDDTPTIG
jgi:hypothetical protein